MPNTTASSRGDERTIACNVFSESCAFRTTLRPTLDAKMKWKTILLMYLAWATTASAGGIVCIDHITIQPNEQSQGFNPTDNFSVSIDKLPSQIITTNSCGVFANLDVKSDHLVVIKRNGNPEASFKFNLQTKGSDHLRLWFNTQYQTWELWLPGRKHECAYLKKQGASNDTSDGIRQPADGLPKPSK